MSAQDNVALARKVYDLFNKNQLDKVLELANSDFEVTLIPFGLTQKGHTGFTEFMNGFRVAFPDITITITNQIGTDSAVVNEFLVKGTHKGVLMTPAGPIQPTGKSINYPVIEAWGIKNGKVSSIRNYFDSATLMRQLGLIH